VVNTSGGPHAGGQASTSLARLNKLERYVYLKLQGNDPSTNYGLPGTVSGTVPGSPSFPGGVNEQTTNYTAQAGDYGKLIVFNSASAATLTLPNPPTPNTWFIGVENINTGVVTINPNGLDLDASASSITLAQNQGVFIYTDGVNYFTERGLATASGGGSGGVNQQTGNYTAVAGDNGKLLYFHAFTSGTLTLPAIPPSNTWNVFVQNNFSGILTISPNGLNINGSGSSLLLSGAGGGATGQGLYITTDGTNYFAQPSVLYAGSVITSNVLGQIVLSLTQSASGLSTAEVLSITQEVGDGRGIVISAPNGCDNALEVDVSNGGQAVVISMTGGTSSDFAISATAGAGSSCAEFNNDDSLLPTVEADNSGGGPDLRIFHYGIFGGVTGGGILFAALPSTYNGAFLFCSDAKNILDDGVAAGSVAVSGGHGALLCRANGSWRVCC
jgi:hypothetical protein